MYSKHRRQINTYLYSTISDNLSLDIYINKSFDKAVETLTSWCLKCG